MEYKVLSASPNRSELAEEAKKINESLKLGAGRTFVQEVPDWPEMEAPA
jgi:hypothetical protein